MVTRAFQERVVRMPVNIEDIGPCKKKVTIEVPSEQVKEKLEESYKELEGTAQVPGFRIGAESDRPARHRRGVHRVRRGKGAEVHRDLRGDP